MSKPLKSANDLHANIPPDWYYRSIKENLLQAYWHKKRFDEVGKFIKPVRGKILDIGCADGVFTRIILEKTKAKEIIGIDVLKSSINWASNHWKDKRMKFQTGDIHKLEFKTSTFDAVFALEILEHVYDPVKALQEIKRVLKRDGYAVFLVPSENFLFKLVWFLWGFYRGSIWKGTHLHEFSGEYLSKLCKDIGFKIEKENKFMFKMLNVIRVKKV